MGCCLSKKNYLPPPSISLTNNVKPTDLSKPVIKLPPATEEAKPVIISEKLQEEEEEATTEEVMVIKHRRSHERTHDESPPSLPVEKSIDSNSNSNSVVVVRTSSCTKEEVDAILIQCGKLSRSNSAAKTRRYSGSKRSFDFDQNERIRGGDVEEEEAAAAAGRKTPQRNRHRGVERVNGSPRERRRRTPSRERDDPKSYRSGSRERGNGGGGGSRRVSRSPGKRSETNPNSFAGSGNLVNSSNIRPGKFVTVPATDKSNNGEPSIKRLTVKRNIGEACRTAASPVSNVQPPPPSLSRSSSRKAEQSPYRMNPLGEIDQNSMKGDKFGSGNNKKMMINREIESVAVQKPNPKTTIRAAASPNRSRSMRKSRDFDFSHSNEEDNNKATNNYTALLLKDIQNFHGKSNNDAFNLLPSCVTKACSIVEAVADLNSSASLSSESSPFQFTSTAKKADLMEPSFERYVTVKRGCSLEEQESCGSNNHT
uniref:Serine/arginine repetitive matrix protein 2 n=1 Tax=Noccaea caerulescens TaxID=107243 RepID=A0A1J3GXP9_NOCCA